MRQALEAAIDHAAALLPLLDGPRLVRPGMVSFDRSTALDAIDAAVVVQDALDGDPDLEDGVDDEFTGDDELSLGWTTKVDQVHLGYDQDDHEVTALERHGLGFFRSGPADAEGGRDAEEDERETLLGWVFGPSRVESSHL